MLKVTVTLTFYPMDPKISKVHLLFMTNVCMKFQKAGPNQTVVVKKGCIRRMDRPTEQPTGAKLYTPSFSKGGIKMSCHKRAEVL